jgi:hypothetical protein
MQNIVLPIHRLNIFTLDMVSMLGTFPPPFYVVFQLWDVKAYALDRVLIVSPGRFFAVNELKWMFAYTLLNFDVKTKDGKRPPNFELSAAILPNMKAEILYRRRTPPPEVEEYIRAKSFQAEECQGYRVMDSVKL